MQLLAVVQMLLLLPHTAVRQRRGLHPKHAREDHGRQIDHDSRQGGDPGINHRGDLLG